MICVGFTDNSGEEWREIKGFPGYMVSDRGQVASFKRKECILLSPGLDRCGYLGYGLHNSSGQHTVKVHVVVMRTFAGECPKGKEVNHKDGDKTNNKLSNLEYVTRSCNVQHAFDTGLKNSLRGENHPSAKLTESDVMEIRRRRASGDILRVLADDYCVCIATIYSVISMETWSNVVDG